MGAYTVNGETFVEISKGGRIIYWITFGLMLFSFVCFVAMTFMRRLRNRSHGYVTCALLFVASCAYYAMASNEGFANEPATNVRNTVRAIYYARYIDWFITTPLLLLDLLLMAALPLGTTMWIVFADVGMIVTGLFGALCGTHFKWGWYTGGCLLQLFIAWGMLVLGTRGAKARGTAIGSLYFGLAIYLVLLWFGYPIVWGLAEGGNVISSDAEAACYAALDILAKVVFGWIIMLSSGVIDRQTAVEAENRRWAPSLLDLPTDAPFALLLNGQGNGVGIANGQEDSGLFMRPKMGRKTAATDGTATATTAPATTTRTPAPTATAAHGHTAELRGPVDPADPASPQLATDRV